jgi:Flp pilus assembly protein TadG
MRRNRGSILIELTAIVFFLLVFTLIAIHAGLLVFGISQNDRACRDAARAAAQGKDQATATQLATVALKAHASPTTFFTSPALVKIVYDLTSSPTKSPTVQATTTTTANLPVGAFVFFGQSAVKNGRLVFTQAYTFPVVKTP